MKQNPLEMAKKQMQVAFRTFDTDKSGFIEQHELQVILKRLTDAFNVQQPSDDEIEDVFKQLDVNGDGKISEIEFQVLVTNVLKIIEEQKEQIEGSQ